MATNSPGATGSRERRFRNILGASWELGAWEFIAQRYSLGGHLGNQKHWSQSEHGAIIAILAAGRRGHFVAPRARVIIKWYLFSVYVSLFHTTHIISNLLGYNPYEFSVLAVHTAYTQSC